MKHLSFIQLTLAIILFVGLVAIYGFWYSVVSIKSTEAAQLAADIQTKSQDTARVAAAKAALASLDADESLVDEHLVPTTDVVSFLEGLETTGAGLGADVEVVSVSAESSGTHPHLNLSLKITGSFDAVLRTLGAIEYGPYDSAIVNVTFDTPVQQAGATELSVWTAAAVFTIGTRAPS